MFIVNLPEEYGYVLLTAAVMAIEVILIGFAIPGAGRKEAFPEKFMKENFGQMHKDAFGDEIKEGGYPDTGNGFYSRSLSYKSWYEYNNKQRAHQNFVEWVASSLTLLLIAGIYFPIVAAGIGALMILARLAYSIGYASSGPNGRLIGALTNDLAFLGLMVFSIWACINWISGKGIA